jgi:uncharacterized protein involved in outer membrane biogenesis
VPNLLRSRVLWIVAIVAALVGLYALLGFQVAPRIVRSQAIEYVRENHGRDLGIGEVRINPFSLQLEVHEVALPDADGSPMLALRRLFVDFEVSSIWERAFVFRDVTLEGPDARLVIRPDGSVNLADLASKESEPPPEEDAGIPSLWLQSLVVDDGRIGFTDRARPTPFVRSFEPVKFALKDFRTTPEGGDFRLSASTERVEHFEWKGRVSLAPVIGSEGSFSIRGLRAPGVAEYLGEALPFGISSGSIEIGGTYRVSLGDSLTLAADLPSIAASDLGLRARGADVDWVQIPSLAVSDVKLALPDQVVSLASVVVSGLRAQAWLAPDGSVNLASLFAPSGVASSGPDGVTPVAATPAEPAPPAAPASPAGPASGPGSPDAPWNVTVANVEVRDASIDLEDRKIAPGTKFAVVPVNLKVTGASLDLSKPVPVTVDAVINGHASVRADGTVTPQPLAADLKLSLERARMQILQPYILPLADLTITGGLLAVAGQARLAPPEAAGPEIAFSGDVAVDGFASIDNALREDLVNFRMLQLKKLRYEMGPDAVSIDQVRIDQPYARVIISEEQVINIAAVLDPRGTAAALEARRAQAAAETPADKRRKERERKEAQKRETKARNARGAPPPQPQEPLPAEAMPIRIREVRVASGTMDFTDHFVEPDFSAKVLDLGGSMTGLSSDPASRAKVDFKGNVGEFSPVSIVGEVQPFAFDRYTDIAMRFENISLPIFNPYSGRLAGYNISKGKLTTDLHYVIEDRKLDADHKIRIDQLEWGEASAAKGEATLPVKFATSLLKDRHGVIDLDVPVTGTLDDPKFRIGPIVWQIIKNLIVKAVTAPFALLGALFEGAEQAQFVDFAPGDAALDATTTGRLAALGKSLVEKPEIKLDVPIGTNPELDRPVLAERNYQQQVAQAMAAKLAKDEAASPALPPFDALSPEQKIEVLTKVVKRQTGAAPQIPEPAAPPEGTSRRDARALREQATIDYLEKQARGGVTVSDADLARLAEDRAGAIQHALLTDTGLDPTRVFVTREGKVTPEGGKVRFELGLQ